MSDHHHDCPKCGAQELCSDESCKTHDFGSSHNPYADHLCDRCSEEWHRELPVTLQADGAAWYGILTDQRHTTDEGSMFKCGSVRVWRWQPCQVYHDDLEKHVTLGGEWRLEWWGWFEVFTASPSLLEPIADVAISQFEQMGIEGLRTKMETAEPESDMKWGRPIILYAAHIHRCPSCGELEKCYDGPEKCGLLDEPIAEGEFEGYKMAVRERLCFGCNRHWHFCDECGNVRQCDKRDCLEHTISRDKDDFGDASPSTCTDCEERSRLGGAWCCELVNGRDCDATPMWEVTDLTAEDPYEQTAQYCDHHAKEVIRGALGRVNVRPIKKEWLKTTRRSG